ncbi:MAG: cupin domain-containing protein [Vicinamibacterales bacterium]|mgnify:CR=1 FL=1
MSTTIPGAVSLSFDELVARTPHGIASRVLVKASGGSATLFAFDAGEGLSEHTSPFEALVIVLDGALKLTIGGVHSPAVPGTIVRMPARVPHAVEADVPTRMLLVLLRDGAE